MTWQARANRMALSLSRRLGNAVTIGAVSGYGFLRSPEEKVYDGMVFLTDYVLELPVLTWPVIAEGTVIAVDGATYRAHEQSRPNTDRSSVFVPLRPLASDPVVAVLDGDFFAPTADEQTVVLDGDFL